MKRLKFLAIMYLLLSALWFTPVYAEQTGNAPVTAQTSNPVGNQSNNQTGNQQNNQPGNSGNKTENSGNGVNQNGNQEGRQQQNKPANSSGGCVDCQNKCTIDWDEGFIIAAPFIIFILALLIIAQRLKKSGNFSLASMLSEKDTAGNMKTIALKAADGTTAEQPSNSTSRFIIFLSGLTAIILSVCMVSYYMYFYVRYGCAPSFDGLLQPLLALGIGVIPYSINKIAAK